MKPINLTSMLMLCVISIASGQAKYKWFSSINASQNTNYFIYHSSLNQVFISSLDGLNIYDGLETKTYWPSTHHMYGNDIQSRFFEDSTGKVWFPTYEALNYYDPNTDNLDYTFMVDSCGDALREGYRIFQLAGNNLYLRADKNVFVYDVAKGSISKTFSLDTSSKSPTDIILDPDKTLLFCIDEDGYEVYELYNNDRFKMSYKAAGNFSAYLKTASNKIWMGKADGSLMQLDPRSGDILFESSLVSLPITGIEELSGDRLLITIHPNEIIEYNTTLRMISDRFIPRRSGTRESADYLSLPYVDKDSTLWVGCASQGIFFYNPRKQKFQHFLDAGTNQKPFNITQILPLEEDRYLIFTRRQGALIINQKGDILEHWLELPDGTKNFTTVCATRIAAHQFLFNFNNKLFLLNLDQGKIKELHPDPALPPLSFAQIEKLGNGKIIASCYEDLLMEIQLSESTYTWKSYGKWKEPVSKTRYFKIDRAGNIYVSNNESSLIVLEPTSEGNHRFSYELPIRGGVNCIMDNQGEKGIYLSNTIGLFYIHSDTKEITPIKDKNNLLSQTIYSVTQDKHGDMWLSTNRGILKYNPVSDSVKVYSIKDGVQADEFNTHAYFQTEDGGIFFGGINGLNFFYPERVTLSTKEAPVYISQVKVNDEVDTIFRVPQFINQYTLKYQQNTISFDFHAIDYADPSATKVKYKMIGVDEDYVESNSVRGFARYANLQPGKYIFSILGANADGVWNATPREVEIVILRPFWMTWWFITFCALAAVAAIYIGIRSYYQRKLERNNQLLREQALIIEKQKAVEHERNRIAAEMHDDLGSGLTTIRYLSDRALKQAKDAEESKQIRKIADHSNKLVRNMSEIIWAMNSRFDNAESLVGYLRRYASEYLDEHQIPLKFIAEAEQLDKIAMGGEKRRNVFLVFKEMLHNGVKYSAAERIEVRIEGNHQLHIEIAEIGGKGFDPELSKEKGNGLFNCCKRMDSVGGQLTFEKTHDAMHIHIRIPINESGNE